MKNVKNHQANLKAALQEGFRNSTEFFCPCGSGYFEEVIKLRRISPIYTPNSQVGFIPNKAIVCIKCKKEVKE